MGTAAVFEGRLGIFIDGVISPPIESVEIGVSDGNGVQVIQVLSAADGQFRYVELYLVSWFVLSCEIFLKIISELCSVCVHCMLLPSRLNISPF